MKTSERARGKWRGILLALGIEERYLTGKHGPCPFCEGRDRFRWDNDKGSGSFICSQCGAGDGIELLKRAKGWDFKTAAREVDAIVGGVQPEKPKPGIDPAQRVDMLNRLWKSGSPLRPGDPACVYLAGRDVLPDPIPACLRYVERCPVPYGGGFAAAMLALVHDAQGQPVNIHRTFLEVAPGEKRMRATMPGELPEGAAIRLSLVHGNRLGIAEGIETALKASRRFGVPVWAALNATMLSKWEPPAGVEQVLVFGDNDPAFGGQAAAFALAHRLTARRKINASVHIPQAVGLDWADSDAA